jgi:hypothetical protein
MKPISLHLMRRSSRRYRNWLEADYPTRKTFPCDSVAVGRVIFLLEPRSVNTVPKLVSLLRHEELHIVLARLGEPVASDKVDFYANLNGKLVYWSDTLLGGVRRAR